MYQEIFHLIIKIQNLGELLQVNFFITYNFRLEEFNEVDIFYYIRLAQTL